jgi:hypothetical protein
MSAIGLYPWNPWSHNDVPIPIGLLILAGITLKVPVKIVVLVNPIISNSLAVIFYVVALNQVGVGPVGLPLDQNNVANFFEKEKAACKGEKFLVDRWENPAVRLYFEVINPSAQIAYGYPENFTFLKLDENGEIELLRNQMDLSDFCGLVLSESFKKYDLSSWNQVVLGQVWIRSTR